MFIENGSGTAERRGVRFYRVAVIEDGVRERQYLEEDLRVAGHQIVVSATDLEEARSLIEELHKWNVDVVLVDGTLDESRASQDDLNRGTQGGELYAAIKSQYPDLPVIPYTRAIVEWGDTPLIRPGSALHRSTKDSSKVGAWITAIVEGKPIV